MIVYSKRWGKKVVIVDKEDEHFLTQFGAYLSKSGQHLYVRQCYTTKYIHRLIMNAPALMVVDHLNRDTLDNRKSNLRICTIQENLRNQKRPNNKTGYTGVAIYPGGRFSAQIKVN